MKAPFKDGDVVSTDDGIFTAIVGKVISLRMEELYDHNEEYDTYCHIYYEEDDDKAYFIADDTPLRFDRLANEEEKERLFQAIKDNGYQWNAEAKTLEKLKVEKFDVTTLKPFDRVLLRDIEGFWLPDLYGYYNTELKAHSCVGMSSVVCIPYEGNEHLLGTTDDCDEFYKTWK